MEWPDHWTSEDGLSFTRVDKGWAVAVIRDIPARLGDPCSVELPSQGALLSPPDVLMAIELSKARIEFGTPTLIRVCEARNQSGPMLATNPLKLSWSLVILPGST